MRITAATIARASELMRARLGEDRERFAPLEPLLEALPDDYDPDETPEERDAS